MFVYRRDLDNVMQAVRFMAVYAESERAKRHYELLALDLEHAETFYGKKRRINIEVVLGEHPEALRFLQRHGSRLEKATTKLRESWKDLTAPLCARRGKMPEQFREEVGNAYAVVGQLLDTLANLGEVIVYVKRLQHMHA